MSAEDGEKPVPPRDRWSRFQDRLKNLLPLKLRDRLEGPALELTAHFLLSILALVFISLADLAMHLLGLSDRPVPIIGVKLKDWMYDLDVISVSAILIRGLIRSLWEK